MEIISNAANGFIKLFQEGGTTFMGWVTGIIPLVVCLMTAVNSVIKLIRRREGGTLRTEADQICSTSLYTASDHRGAVLRKPDVLYLRTFRRREIQTCLL